MHPNWSKNKKKLFLAVVILGLIFVIWLRGCRQDHPEMVERPQPVSVASVVVKDVPVYIQGLGTITPMETVLVKSRVDGQLMELRFHEGQNVSQGDILAVIDQRPYEVKLLQAQGAYVRDEAMLAEAKTELARFRKLIKEGSVSLKQLQAQEALVGQYTGLVAMDKAAIADAELQLSYCTITAPVSGRVGLKQIDRGNMVRASDSGGLVVITPMQPIYVVFSIVERQIPEVWEAMQESPLLVEAWNQDNTALLDSCTLQTLDNQIDPATGTVKAKAECANSSLQLFPKQFVNTKLLAKNLYDALVVPSAAVQRGLSGFFVYAIKKDSIKPAEKTSKTKGRTGLTDVTNSTSAAMPDVNKFIARVTIVPVSVVYTATADTVVSADLAPGDFVVTDGVDRLREDALIVYSNN